MNLNLLQFFGKKRLFSKCFDEDTTQINHGINKLTQEFNCTEFNIVQIEKFLHLTEEDNIIRQFLEFDTCYKLADKYLLAIVFVYFIRAKLNLSEYNRANFFPALYLAHDIEEDDDTFKDCIISWGLGRTRVGQKRQFLKERDQLWLRMGYRAFVSIKCCEQVMNSMPNSPLWQRERSLVYLNPDGIDCKMECPTCPMDELIFYHTDLESEYGSDTDEEMYFSDTEEETVGSMSKDDSSEISQETYSPPTKRLRINEP